MTLYGILGLGPVWFYGPLLVQIVCDVLGPGPVWSYGQLLIQIVCNVSGPRALLVCNLLVGPTR